MTLSVFAARRIACFLLMAASCLFGRLDAGQLGVLTYQQTRTDWITITDCSTSAYGHVTIPAEIDGIPVREIGSRAFAWCIGISRFTIPDGMSIFGREAFLGCSRLTEFSIPATVDDVGYNTFDGCSDLTAFSVDSRNRSYVDVDGVLCNLSRTRVIRCPEDKSGTFSIPSNATVISDYAFSSCSRLKGVTIPAGVIHIGRNAFEGCDSLPDLTIPASVNGIGVQAFRYCDRTTAITVEPGNEHYTSIDGVLFDILLTTLIQCPGRKEGEYEIPPGVTEIADYAFHGCEHLTGISFPASVATIGDHVFGQCRGLTSIEIPEAVTHLGEYVFFSCRGLSVITFTDGLVSIGPSAFSHCISLTRLVVPAGVTTIGASAFAGCSSLGSVVIPAGVTLIGNNAFNFCDVLTVATFLGDAPTMECCVFLNAPAELTVYYLSGGSGYSSPTWADRPAVEIVPDAEPVPFWLVTNGFPHDSDLQQDLNGDGVTLFTAHALDLDPRNAVAGLPQAVLGPGTLSIEFHASAPGIRYLALTSDDLENWVADGVTLSDLDAEGRRTATVSATTPRRYLRLEVAPAPAP